MNFKRIKGPGVLGIDQIKNPTIALPIDDILDFCDNQEENKGSVGFTTLNDFYLLDGKLLYASDNFIGYDPVISIGLPFIKPKSYGTIDNVIEFTMNTDSYKAVVTYSIEGGPLRGYRGIEIFKDDIPIVGYKAGSMGHGSNFFDGKKYFLKGQNAYLVLNGNSMKDFRTDRIYLDSKGEDFYFFCFNNIVLPTFNSKDIKLISWIRGQIYLKEDVEPFRQIEWTGDIHCKGHNVHIVKSSVPGIWQTKYVSPGGYGEFKKFDGMTALTKKEIWIDGQKY